MRTARLLTGWERGCESGGVHPLCTPPVTPTLVTHTLPGHTHPGHKPLWPIACWDTHPSAGPLHSGIRPLLTE